MKKIIILAFFALSMSIISQAQIKPHALGLRLSGDGDINGAEISYQHGLSKENRLEVDLGFGSSKHHNRTFVTGIYQWVWNLDGGLNWYAGPGATLGLFHYDGADDYMNLGLGGQIGLEYDFNKKGAPILLSLDARPMWNFIGDHAGFGWGAAFSIRYTW